ncbi:hypothetical protein, partial [Lentimicrobium sp.]|uniref:hypothetical protein n=1 Tax=Lentimicrobium sp. TaxID=2034841 RepID=UPI002C593B94
IIKIRNFIYRNTRISSLPGTEPAHIPVILNPGAFTLPHRVCIHHTEVLSYFLVIQACSRV